MEENELEEGEACSYHEDDPTVDPDIALSYIDEKIQHVLGQFQKDFEGGVCAQNLGAKFGDYGSFLPAYQRSPSILSQPRSPNKGTNCGVARFPHITQPEQDIFPNKNTVTNSSNALRNKLLSTSTHSSNGNPNKPLDHSSTGLHELANRSLNGKNSKSFKFRIKVGSENAQSRNNADLYSGLGLDMSPSSSSFEDSPDVNEDLPHRSHDSPSVSPHSTYKLYSCFQISTIVARLLSPVSESMLQLVDKKTQHQKQGKSEERIPLRNDNSYLGKSRNPTGRSGLSELPSLSEVSNINPKVGGNNRNDLLENPVTDVCKKEITLSTHSGLKCAAEKSVRVSDGDKVSVSGIPKRPEKSVGKGRGVPSGPVPGEPSGNSVEDKSVRAVIERFPSKNELVVDPFPDVKHSLDDSYDIRNNVTDKPCNKPASAKESDEGYKGGENKSSKMKLPQNSYTNEQGMGRNFERKLKSSGGKRKNKESGSKIALPLESVKGISSAVSGLSSKEKKKSVSSKGERVKSQHNALRPPKEMDRSVSREGRNMVNSHFKESERGGDRLESIGDRIKHGHEDAHMQLAQTEHLKDKNTGKMVENMSSLADKGILVTAAAGNIPSLETVQHIDEWVCCDKCQKWRLLPFGATTAKFPQNWICSMLDWLPGMNKCSVSEEDTTKACKAFYEPHPAGHVALTGLCGVVQSTTRADSQYHQQSGDFLCPGVAKKKPVKDALDVPGQPPAVSAIYIKPRQQTSLRNKNPNDVKSTSMDPVALIKSGTLQLSESHDFSTENHNFKQKEKDCSIDQYSDGGDSLEKSRKRSKSKSTGEFIQAGFRTSKKLKMKESKYGDEDSHSIHSFECKAVDDTGYSRKMSSKNHEENSFSSASKSDLRDNSKKISIVRSAERVKGNFYMSDQDMPDIPLKRKSLEWEENGAHFEADVQEEACEAIRRKEKKYKLSESEVRELSVGEVSLKADQGRIFPLSFKMDQLTSGVEKQGDFGKVDQCSQKNTDELGSLKREPVQSQPSAATSSSSKVSGSRKSKTRFSETRGSPVESVSSSPLRSYAIVKLSTKKNKQKIDNTVELDSSQMLSPQKGSAGKVNGMLGEFGTKVKLKTRDTPHSRSIETNRSADSRFFNPAYTSLNNKIGNDSTGKAANSLYAKLFGCTDDEPSPSGCENNDVGADALISSEQPDSDASHHFNGHSHEQNELAASLHHVPLSDYQRKSGKISSSQTMVKYRNSMGNYGGKMEMTTQRTSSLVVDDNLPASGFHVTSHVVCTDLEDTREDTQKAGKELKNSSVKIGGKGRYEGKRDNPANSSIVVNKEANGSYSQAKDLSAKICQSATVTRNREECQKDENCQTTSCKVDKRDSDRLLTERIDKSSRGRLEQLPNIKDKKRESHDRALQAMQVTAKDDQSDGRFTEDVKGHSEKLLKQGKKTENQSEKTINGLDTSNGYRKSPSLSVTNVIREARDLKHTANRKKNEGLEHESTPLYFQAALKFLHGASLLESSNSDSSKLGEMTSSIQIYSETAKLCEFCAHEYEKQNEFAAVALAYKCMEVAYMKVVYSKHPLAIKDRQELQAAPRIGESPSSSASDVDNANNQSNADKMTLDKVTNSTQVAGSHVIAARNRPNFVRMLSFAEIVNFAMDASRKSINAFASASVRNETDKDVERLLSVRRVLDFSFHDIEGLLRLVRLSMEYISR